MLRWPDGRIRPLLFDGSPVMPSAVYATAEGRLLVGRDAERSARVDPGRLALNPKRYIDEGMVLLGDRQVPLVEVIAATMRRIAEEATRAAGGAPAETVVTYPAAWGALRRGALIEATTRAGLPAPTLVPEPVAAAAYFATVLGHRVVSGQVVVVYDLGAGTLDVSAVRRTPDGYEVLAVDGLPDFGGLDLDEIVVKAVGTNVDPEVWRRLTAPLTPADQRHFRTLWDDARAAKEMLSRQPSAGLHVPVAERDVIVTRDEFEAAAREPLNRAAELTAHVMAEAGVRANDLAGLFLVGGSSRVPMVATILHRVTGIAPTVLEQPEIVVAEGALHATGPRTAPPSTGTTLGGIPSGTVPPAAMTSGAPSGALPAAAMTSGAGAMPSAGLPPTAMAPGAVSPAMPPGAVSPSTPSHGIPGMPPAGVQGVPGVRPVHGMPGVQGMPGMPGGRPMPHPVLPSGPAGASPWPPPSTPGGPRPAGPLNLPRPEPGSSKRWVPITAGAAILVVLVAVVLFNVLNPNNPNNQEPTGSGYTTTAIGAEDSPANAAPKSSVTPQPEYPTNTIDAKSLLTDGEVKRYVNPVRRKEPDTGYELHEDLPGYIWTTEANKFSTSLGGSWTSLWIGVKFHKPNDTSGVASSLATLDLDTVRNIGETVEVPSVDEAIVEGDSLYLRNHNIIVVVSYVVDKKDASVSQLLEIGGLVIPRLPKL